MEFVFAFGGVVTCDDSVWKISCLVSSYFGLHVP